MRRRAFIAAVCGATAWPLVARAQPMSRPVIGFLDSGSQAANSHLVSAFQRGLNEVGYVEGQNLTIEYRWANGEYDQLPGLATELVRIPVAVLATGGGEPAARAARAATTTIPIIFDTGSSPVDLGWVSSLSRPGGNMTGVNQMVGELASKQLGLLHELIPDAHIVGMLANPQYPSSAAIVKAAQAAASSLGLALKTVMADSEQNIEAGFQTLAQQHVTALFVAPAPLFYSRRDRITGLAARFGIPTVYVRREFATAGGLMSYGTSLVDTYRQLGAYAGRILNGEKVSDLPVMQPTKFELVINLKTAKALGLTVPPSLLARADEVIE